MFTIKYNYIHKDKFALLTPILHNCSVIIKKICLKKQIKAEVISKNHNNKGLAVYIIQWYHIMGSLAHQHFDKKYLKKHIFKRTCTTLEHTVGYW